MIEIELKYKLAKPLELNEMPTKEKIVEDIYYDTNQYTLLKTGNFMRIRNGKTLDFKLNANSPTHLFCKETNFAIENLDMEGVLAVLQNIGVEEKASNLEELTQNLQVLAPIKKYRKTYQLEENIEMVIDEVENLGTFLEIEYDLEQDTITKEEAQRYQLKLKEILNQKGFIQAEDEEIFIGYVELYLKQYNPEAFRLGIYQ